MPEFVRYKLQHVVGALKRFRPGSGIAGHAQTYILHNQSLVAEREVQANAALMLRHHSQRPTARVELPFSARLVTVGRNARIFGLNGNESVTAKVALVEAAVGDSFFREVRARSIAARFLGDTALSIPRILWKNPARGWFVEECINGSPAGDEDMARLVSLAMPLYRPTIRVRPMASSHHNRRLVLQLVAMLRELAPRLATVDERASWLNALCHGDLGRHNVLRGADGRVWILDWEKARFLPVAFELGGIYIENPRLGPDLLDLIDGLTADRGVLPSITQLALGAAFALKWRELMRTTRIGERVMIDGESPSAASADYDLGTIAARKAIAGLAG